MAKGIPDNIDIVRAMDQLLRNPRVAFSPEAVRRVRDELVAMRGMKDRVEETIKRLQEGNAALMNQVEELRKAMDGLVAASAQKDAELSGLRSQLADKEVELSNLAAEVDAMVDAAALEALARQMRSSSPIDGLDLACLGDEATELLKRIGQKWMPPA